MKIALRFYYTSGSVLSESARDQLRGLRTRYTDVAFEIEEIDVVLHPLMAEEDGIVATPAVVKLHPSPIEKIVGDFSQLEQFLGLHRSLDHRQER